MARKSVRRKKAAPAAQEERAARKQVVTFRLSEAEALGGLIVLLVRANAFLTKLDCAIHGPAGKLQARPGLNDGSLNLQPFGGEFKLTLGQLYRQRLEPRTVGAELSDLGGWQLRLDQSKYLAGLYTVADSRQPPVGRAQQPARKGRTDHR